MTVRYSLVTPLTPCNIPGRITCDPGSEGVLCSPAEQDERLVTDVPNWETRSASLWFT
jgi:hypothetical protein